MIENSLNHYRQNALIQEALKKSIEDSFPIESGNKIMEISNVTIDDILDSDDFPKQKEFKLSRKSWQIPINASVKITDKDTGAVLDQKTKIKIGAVPKLTNRFTAIIDGNEYQTTNQIRRKSGIYARVKNNGQLESEFNLSKGFNFKMQLDPKKQVFNLILNNRKYRLWNLLKLLDVPEQSIVKAWGDELLLINKKGAMNNEVAEMTSIYKKIYKDDETDFAKIIVGLQGYFNDYTEVDPETTKLTLGESHSKVTGATLLAASKKLLNISKGKDKPDDRDSLIFKQFYGVDDLLVSHFINQNKTIKSKLTRRLGMKDMVREVISTGTFGKPIKDFFTMGDLTATPPQTNPLTILADWQKTTPMGPGGIPTSHSITMDTRDVQPTHLGFIDPMATPESGKVGITTGMSIGLVKNGDNVYTPVINKKGKKVYMTPLQLFNTKVGFPDQYKLENKKPVGISDEVTIQYKGNTIKSNPSEVEVYLYSPQDILSFATNLVPFIKNTQGNRASTGGRMMQQAVSLKDKEAPLVQVKDSKSDKVFEHIVGNFLNPTLGEGSGKVVDISKDYITIKKGSGETIKKGLYNNFPLNQDGYLDSIPLVKIGDKVSADTALADNNYSTKGVLSLGKNLSVAYMPWKGYNFEDGAVITKSAAEKLSHEMLHRKNIFFSPASALFGIKKFMSWYPTTVTSENLSKLTKDGLPKVGAIFQPGELIAAYLDKRDLSEVDKIIKKMHKSIFTPYIKKVVEWDEEEPGEVIEVRSNGRNIDIYIKAVHPFKEGDKLSGRYGNKNIVTKIIPDSDAPHRPNGSPVDIIVNPHGIPGRMNIGQMLETAAGKLALHTGKPYFIENFSDGNASKKVMKELKDAGLDANEVLTNGKLGEKFGKPIFVGNQYFMKLRHIVKKKQASHSIGQYDINEQPTGKGAQKADPMLTYSMLSHGAKKNLYEMSAIKGRQNDEYWRRLQMGLPPGKPAANYSFNKMIEYLKAAGVNTEKNGNIFRATPLTDSDVLKMSAGELSDPGAMLIGKNLMSRKGGLFDDALTGGASGKKWTHIELVNQIPSPMYEQAIMKLLGITQVKYTDILMGKDSLNGLKGVEAIKTALKNIDVKKTIVETKNLLDNAAPSEVNKINKKLRYLKALESLGLSPEEAYLMKYVPVLPPVFRPIYPLPSGDLMVSDMNKHYKDVGVITKNYEKLKKQSDEHGGLSDEAKLDYNYALYNSVKALQGFIDPVNYGGEKYKGVIKELSGDQVKYGLVHSTTWSKRQDVSARSTITVEPSLGLDEIGLPKKTAASIYKPFVIRELVRQGMPASRALKHVKDETAVSDAALQRVAASRPVILNRAPSLHKHSILAFNPVIHEGKGIQLNPLVVGGFNADFDGDTMAIHTPVENEAVSEAKTLYPSKNIFKNGDNAIVPSISQEYLLGTYYLSEIKPGTGKIFNSVDDAKDAKTPWTESISIAGKTTTIGQELLNQHLPKSLKDYTRLLDKKNIKKVLTTVAKEYPNDFSTVLGSWKDLGNVYSFKRGTTVSLTDFDIDRSYRDNLIKERMPKINGLKGQPKIDALNQLTLDVQKAQDKELKDRNNVYDMLTSGSFSKAGSARQILSMPGVLLDIKGNPIEVPVHKSYGEGIDTPSYWNSLYAVRKGTVDRSVNTMDSGALNKSLLAVTRRLIIVEEDCKTHKGLDFLIDSKDVMDRLSAETIPNVIVKNTIVDSQILLLLKMKGIKELKVRSPLTCESSNGICSNCYGLLPNGELPSIGENVGVSEGQALTERSTQLTMQTFHSGGDALAGGGILGGFPRTLQLLEVPANLANKAVLSDVKGSVKTIRKNPIGGYELRIEGYGIQNDKTFSIPPNSIIKVKIGDKVNIGDALTEGPIKPQELGALTSHLDAQRYIVDEINDVYNNDFNKKTFETVVRAISDFATIDSAPNDVDFERGDKTSKSYIESLNKGRLEEGLEPIQYTPYFKSIETSNVDNEDWLTKFTTNRIKSAVQEAASSASYADIAGKDPIPAYIYGDTFGKQRYY